MNPVFELKKLDVRVKKPVLGSKGAAAFDLQACRTFDSFGQPVAINETIRLMPGETINIGSGLAVHMCRTDVGAFILPRSGRGSKGLVVGNLVGLIDSDYQGELIVCLWNRNTKESGKVEEIQPLERIAQLTFVPVLQVDFKEVEEFSADSERGAGGFGSTGSH